MSRVLIVDDEEDILYGLSVILSRGGWEVLTARSVEEAREILNTQPVDVVVTDVRMPGESGLVFLQEIKSTKKDLRTVIMTAKGSPEMEREVVSMGADAYVEKPFDLDYFMGVLKKVITSKGFRGVMQELTLVDVLQLLAYESGTALVEVSSVEGMGRIWIKDGKVVHAEIREISGVEAFERILSLEGGSFSVKRGVETDKQTIYESLDSLLLRTVSASEEAQAQQSVDLESWSLLGSFEVEEEIPEDVKSKASGIIEMVKAVKGIKGVGVLIGEHYISSDGASITQESAKSIKKLLKSLQREELFIPGNPDYYFIFKGEDLVCLEVEGLPLAVLRVEIKKLF
ncbi:MAG: response regulator [candidate division WOR-3 bacterium]